MDAPEGVRVLPTPRVPWPLLLAEPDPSVVIRGTALFVPGFTGSKEDFIAVLAPLSRLGWRVAAMDLPGQNGARAVGARGTNSVAALAGAVCDVVHWLGAGRARVHLVGHSAGGLVSTQLLLDSAQMLASLTLLCSGPGSLPAHRHAQLRELVAALDHLPMKQVWAAKTRAEAATASGPPPPPRVAAFLRRRFMATDPAALADLAEALMQTPDRTEAMSAALAQPHAPSLEIVTGSADDAWPVATQQALAAGLGVPWHLMHGVGHSPAAQAPAATARVMDRIWAKQHQPGRAPGAAPEPAGAGRAGHRGSGLKSTQTGVISATAGYTACMALHATLECDRLAPRTARRVVCEFLSAHQLDALTDDAALLTSELVTNAVRHARGPIHVDAYLRASRLRLEVADDTPNVGPAPRRADLHDESGRGMELIEKMALRWGWDTVGQRKVVWLELAI